MEDTNIKNTIKNVQENGNNINNEPIAPEVPATEDLTPEDVEKFLNSIDGRTEYDDPKCSICFIHQKFEEKDGELNQNIVNEATLFKPTISIGRRNEFCQVDITFFSPTDTDMNVLWNAISNFFDSVDEDYGKENILHTSQIILMPAEYGGKMYGCLTDPIFVVLEAEKPGTYPTKISLLFKDDAFDIFANNEFDTEAAFDAFFEEDAQDNRLDDMYTNNKPSPVKDRNIEAEYKNDLPVSDKTVLSWDGSKEDVPDAHDIFRQKESPLHQKHNDNSESE